MGGLGNKNNIPFAQILCFDPKTVQSRINVLMVKNDTIFIDGTAHYVPACTSAHTRQFVQ